MIIEAEMSKGKTYYTAVHTVDGRMQREQGSGDLLKLGGGGGDQKKAGKGVKSACEKGEKDSQHREKERESCSFSNKTFAS